MWRVKSWRWFTTRVGGLLADDTPIARFFAPDPAAEQAPRPEPEARDE